MTEENNGVLFTDGRDRVFFHSPKAYPDGHGFRQQIDIVSGPFQGSIEASSYEGPEALARFRRELVSLYENLEGEARLPRSYEDIRMSLKGDGLGHVALSGEVMAGNLMGARLSFSFTLDQTQLPDIIKAIDEIFLR